MNQIVPTHLNGKVDYVLNNLARLSPREKSVLRLIVRGGNAKQIAGELHLSPRTVETHRERVIMKLGADGTLDLLATLLQAFSEHRINDFAEWRDIMRPDPQFTGFPPVNLKENAESELSRH
ncbi:MAG: helix-turn-helix transcriptional regulator [Hyphomicrobiaceae bacterium]|nr:helix-turn-helix transcriptional regulator [Hyphomicrobiaceae bacterium]